MSDTPKIPSASSAACTPPTKESCPLCLGSGQIVNGCIRTLEGELLNEIYEPCDECDGTGKVPVEDGSLAVPLPKCCGVSAPDRSGRTCDKPRGHDGDHWTYGMETLTWG
jgi:DnaJ-class molecular chaperone